MSDTESMQTPREEETLAAWGRRLVGESAKKPLDALEFLGRPGARTRRGPPTGAPPGEMSLPGDAPEPELRVMSFGPDVLEERVVERIEECHDLVERPDRISWLDVKGFGDRQVLERIGEQLGIHPLAMADVVHVPQRPKAEVYGDRLLVICQMTRVTEDGEIVVEQLGLVLGPGWVVSFQEGRNDILDPVRVRIRTGSPRMRRIGADYLLYSLIDTVIDGYFPVVESLGSVIDAMEVQVVEAPDAVSLARLHAMRRTLLTLHRVQWRQRDAIGSILRDEEAPIGPGVRPYLRDAHDHAFQTLDAIETYREMVSGLMDLYLSSASHRMNEVMKTLTIVATIFIPLTFVAGVYGMNFDYMPELRWRWGYPVAWSAMVGMALGLIGWMRYRGWLVLGRPRRER